MSKTTLPKKKITVEVAHSLHKKFLSKVRKNSTSMTQEIEDFMQSYIKRN